MGEAVAVREWKWWSAHHIATAALFARKAAAVEASGLKYPVGDEASVEVYGFAIGAVLASVNFLEALINELWAAANDPLVWSSYQNQDEKLRLQLANMATEDWRIPILPRFQLALAAAGAAMFDKGLEPFQSAAEVIRLRNELVHYQPRWVQTVSSSPSDAPKPSSLASRFPIGPLLPQPSQDTLDKYIGAGMARWACQSSLNWADAFSDKLAIVPVYAQQRQLHRVLP